MAYVFERGVSLLGTRREPSFIEREKNAISAHFKRSNTRITSNPYLSFDDIDVYKGKILERRLSLLSAKDKVICASKPIGGPNFVNDLSAYSPYGQVDNTGEGKDSGSPPKYRETSLPRKCSMVGGTTELQPRNADDDISIMSGMLERRRSFLFPYEDEVAKTAKKDDEKKVPSPTPGQLGLDSLMGDGHISRNGDSDTSNAAKPPRVKSFRTELDLYSVDFTQRNGPAIPSLEEFKDNPFELNVDDLVDGFITPVGDSSTLGKNNAFFLGGVPSSSSSAEVPTLPQTEMQRLQENDGGSNNNNGSIRDTSNSKPAFPLVGGSNEDPKKYGMVKREELKKGPTPILTNSEMHIPPLNVWQPIGKGIPGEQKPQPGQEQSSEKESSIGMVVNPLPSLLDSPCFTMKELEEYMKTFSPIVELGTHSLDTPSPLQGNINGNIDLEYSLLDKDSNRHVEKLLSQQQEQQQIFASKSPPGVEQREGNRQMNYHSLPPIPSVEGTSKRQTSEEVSKRLPVSVLEVYYHLPLCRASEELRVSLTMLKKLCRQYGLTRWPHRQVSSLNKSISKHEEKLKGCKEKEHAAQIRDKIVNFKTKRALIIKSASAGLNTDVLNAVFAAKPGEVDEIEIIRTGDFSQLASLVKTRNSANQYTQPRDGEKQPSIPLERSSASCPPQSSSTAPTWAWQTQQQCHPTDENGFASGEFQELVANNNTRHHNVHNQDYLSFPSLVREKSACDLEPSTATQNKVTSRDDDDIFSNMLKKFSD